MAKSGKNYLDLVRNSLYNNNNTKNEEIRKCSKIKQVAFVDIIKCDADLQQNVGTSSRTVEKRICTPFKSTKSSVTDKTILITDEKVSPSLNNSNMQSDSLKKDKKRRLLSFDTSEVHIKRKKGKSTKIGIKLNFDESTENLIMSSNRELKNKKKSLNKKKKTKNSRAADNVINGLHSLSSPNITSPNKLQNPLPIVEDAADFYDNKKVVVKGLKFKRFCNLFPATHNEQLQSSNNAFSVPKEYFRNLKSDDFELVIEAVNLRLGTINEVQDQTVSKHISNNITSDSKPNSNQENNRNIQRKKVDILDDQVLSPGMQKGSLDSVSKNDSSEKMAHQKLASPSKILNLKNGNKIVILEQLNQMAHFHGLCCLEVLNGEVEILGASLTRNSGDKKVYSPRGTSLMYIRNKRRLYDETKVELRHLISEDLLHKTNFNLVFNQHCAILLCKELWEPYIEFIERHISQIIFPESSALGARVNFQLSGNWNITHDSEEWEDIMDSISESSKVIVCGGKGVGKSSFLRYAINMLLKRFKKIRFVELDPGQSEFYPPGCIAVATVDQCVLGPNYTHLQSADRLILSHINMGYNVNHYLRSVKYLLESMEVLEIIPTLINFPGFTQGLGLDIAAYTVNLLRPTLVIEIKSKNYSKNYKMDMTSENIDNLVKESKILGPQPIYNSALNYEFVKFSSLAEKNEAWSLEGRQAREICILSYFGKMMSDNVRDLTSSAIDMFSIKISAITITSSEGKIISPLAINGSLVALCSTVQNESELFISYGYGFVRGMDLDADTLVLLTPEPIEKLENVSHLVLSSVTTPPSLVMSASHVKGYIPFVNVGNLVDFGQFTKRSYLPPKK